MRALSFRATALGAAGLLGISYILCVLYDLMVPQSLRMYPAWAPLLPGFTWLSWGSFIIGLVEVILYGLYAAAVFVPLYNYARRRLS